MSSLAMNVVFTVVLTLVTCLFVLISYSTMYQKVGPNEALIVYGRGGTKIVTGSGTFLVPAFQHAQLLSLELVSIHLAPDETTTADRVAILLEADALLKVRADAKSIAVAAEHFLGKRPDQWALMLKPILESRLRSIVTGLTAEQALQERDTIGARLRSDCSQTFASMGLEIYSCTITSMRQAAVER